MLTAGPRGVLPRHQTLRTAIDWSHDLCTEGERLLWSRLSVFAGDFDLGAAEAVCADGALPREGILDRLAGLVDQSIVLCDQGGARYQMLDTLREYGGDLLREAGEERAFRVRHRDHFLELVRWFEAEWKGSEQLPRFHRLHRERANLRTALEFSYSVPDEEAAGLDMAGLLQGYWLCSSRYIEGAYWLRRGLERTPEPVLARARALWFVNWMGITGGAYGGAAEGLAEARRLAGLHGDDWVYANATQLLASVLMFQGEIERSMELWRELRPLALGFGDPVVSSNNHMLGAMLHATLGQDETAMELSGQGLEVYTGSDERWSQGWTHYIRGMVHFVAGRRERCAEHMRRSILLKAPLADMMGGASCLEFIGWIAADGDCRTTAWTLGAADAYWQKLGTPMWGMERLADFHDRAVERATEVLGAATYAKLFQKGLEMPHDEIVARLSEPAAPAVDLARLTRRERQVAGLVAEGLTNRQIADRLMIAKRTADTHIEHILEKLAFSSRTQIAVLVAGEDPPPG